MIRNRFAALNDLSLLYFLIRSKSAKANVALARPIAAIMLVGGLGLAGCAQRPQDVAVSHGKEYFPSSIYGPASKRVIADGQPVPRGGGQYLVGKPYTVAGRTYYPSESKKTQIGNASWYGDAFHGRLTANGEIYDRDAYTAASPTLPIPSYARITNLRNNYSMVVRVNDRGPYASDRIMDVSRRVAEALDYKRYGTTKLKVEYVGRASLAGSDDGRLYATLRTGTPLNQPSTPTMVARKDTRVRVASNSSDVQVLPRRYLSEAEPEDVNDESYSRRPAEKERVSPSPVRHRSAESPDDVLERETPYEGRDTPRGRHSKARYEDARAIDSAGQRDSYVEREGSTGAKRASRIERVATLQAGHPGRESRIAPSSRTSVLPPSRPMDLGTIPGAASQIRARRETPRLRTARSFDD